MRLTALTLKSVIMCSICYAKRMNRRLLIFPLLAVALTVGGLVYNQTTLKSAPVFFWGALGLSAVILRYFSAFRTVFGFVSEQADGKNINPAKMWLIVIGKTFLYLFVPAAIVTAVMVGIALYVTR